MAENSKIEWTDHTFNPWMGCTKVHTGCTNCYAETLMDSRWGKVQWGPNGTRVVAADSAWRNPIKWNKAAEKAGLRAKVFCASLADVFEDWNGPLINGRGERLKYNETHGIGPWQGMGEYAVDATMDHLRERLFSVILRTPWLDWLILTKRPENIRRMWPWGFGTAATHDEAPAEVPRFPDGALIPKGACYRSNVWLLTSVSNQETADKQIPELLKCRDLVPVLGLSCEPLLGSIDLWPNMPSPVHGPGIEPVQLDWVIVGGESGNGARDCWLSWCESIVDQCGEANVPVFVKQLGARPRELSEPGEDWVRKDGPMLTFVDLKDKKGGDWSEWPEELRVRQYPERVAP